MSGRSDRIGLKLGFREFCVAIHIHSFSVSFFFFYSCFRPLISWLLSFVFIRYLRSQLLFRHGEFCLFEPSLGSFAERWVNRMLETHSGETSVLWGASQEAYTDRCLAFFFCSNDFLSMTTHFWFVSVIFHDSLRHKFVGIHG